MSERPGAPPLCERPEDVTAPWLTAALRAAGRIGDACVVAISTEPVGTGQMADSVRYALSYDRPEADAPASVVGKFSSADPVSRATGLAMRSYEIEACFYRELAPTVGIRTPRCDYAAVDASTGASTLLLEDLAPGEQGDQVAGCTVDQAALALEELARLHAPRWADPALERLEWLHRTNDVSVEVGAQLLPGLWPGFVDRYADRLPPEVVAMGERFLPRVREHLAGQPRPWTVQHGDYRLDNMLFGTAGGGYPLAVVDWQTVIHGPGAADLAYFLGAGLPVEVRRSAERELVATYHEALVAGGVEGYPADRCWHDYRRFAFSGFLMAVGASMMVARTDRGDEMFVAMAERHGAQILDLEAESLLATA